MSRRKNAFGLYVVRRISLPRFNRAAPVIALLAITVPAPHVQASPTATGESRRQHPLAKLGKCKECHSVPAGAAKKAYKVPPDTRCARCHKMSTKSRYLHGPVAVGACSVCHSVHKAKASNLLATAGKTLCFKCHNEKRFGAATKHPAMKGSCIDCHSSHGGNNRYFVRASAGGNPIQSRR